VLEKLGKNLRLFTDKLETNCLTAYRGSTQSEDREGVRRIEAGIQSIALLSKALNLCSHIHLRIFGDIGFANPEQ
jgi:hypothetical protein